MIQHNYRTQSQTPSLPLSAYSCPIARIEAERRMSPMAMLVARTSQQPAFA